MGKRESRREKVMSGKDKERQAEEPRPLTEDEALRQGLETPGFSQQPDASQCHCGQPAEVQMKRSRM